MVVTFKKIMAAIEADPEFAKNFAARSSASDDDQESAAEIARLFQFVGRYVVLFQDIEGKLDQIILLAIGHKRWHVGQGVLLFLSNAQKIDLIHTIVKSSEIANGDPFRVDWLASFEEVIRRLKTEAARRNRIVHSLYIFDFMKIEAPQIRSKRKLKKGDVDFEQEDIDEKFIAMSISEVAELSFDIGMALTQLIHWSELLGKMGSSPDCEGFGGETR